MSKRVWDNWLVFWGLTSSYFLGLLGWAGWHQGQIAGLWINNTWSVRVTIWLVVTFVLIWGGFWYLWRRNIWDTAVAKQRLKIITIIAFSILIIAQVSINFNQNNFFGFINFWQNQAYLWQTIVWVWLIGLIIIWFWPLKFPARWSKVITPKRVIWGTMILFGVIFGAAGLYLHQNLHTHAFDFGIYDQGLWQLAYKGSLLNTVNGYGNTFGAHFQPILFLLVPFYWLWNNPRMLILLEVGIVALGAIPIYRLAMRRFSNLFFAAALVFGYLLFVGNQETLAYPFHPSTFLAPLLLFAYDYFDQKRWGWHILFMILALLVKENAGIYVATFGLVILIMKREFWRLGLVYMVIGLGWVAIETKLILPAISGQAYAFFSYETLGNNMVSAIKTVVLNPLYSLRVMWDSVNKVGTFLALSGGSGLLIYGSPYGLLTLPTLGEKLWSSRGLVTIFAHYGAPMAFGLGVATLESVNSLYNFTLRRWRILKPDWLKLASIVIILATLGLCFNQNLYLKRFLRGDFVRFPEKQALNMAIKQIPKDAAVSAQGIVLAQVAHRQYIYQFPEINRADYIILTIDGPKYPLSEEGYRQEIDMLLSNTNWGLIFNKGGVAVWEKGKPDKVQPTTNLTKYLEKR